MSNKAFTLEDLDATKACSIPFEFEYVDEQGEPSGVWLSVYGSESEIVQKETARLQNERRRRQAAREVQSRVGVGQKKVEVELYESDIEYGKRVAASRLAGWRAKGQTDGLSAEDKARFCGIDAPFTPENALRLCQSNALIAGQITVQSEASANFTKR